MVNTIVSIPGYVHLYRSLLRFYDMPENEIREMLYLLNTANLDCYGYYHPERELVESGPVAFCHWLETMDCRPYRTEVQLYKSLLFLQRSVDRNLIVTSQREALQTLKCIMQDVVHASIKRFSLPNKKRRDYLLRGKVFCGCCDHAMSLRNDVWFYCRHSEVAENLPCHGVRVKMVDLEQAVFEIIRAQMCPALGIDSSKDKLDLQTVQQAEHEDKLHSIQDSKRQLYEQYALGEIDLETYRERKAIYDAELVQAKNVHAAITAQTKQIQSDYEARLKQREIVQEVDSAGTLTQALIDRLINKVYIFPGDRIEIEYVTQDFLATAESGKEA